MCFGNEISVAILQKICKMDEIILKQSVEDSFTEVNKGQIYKAVIGHTEKLLIEKALQKTGGNQILAARMLGLNRNTIRSKIRKLNIDTEKYKA